MGSFWPEGVGEIKFEENDGGPRPLEREREMEPSQKKGGVN